MSLSPSTRTTWSAKNAADSKEAEVASFLTDVLPIYKALGLTAFEPGPEQLVAAKKTSTGTDTETVPLFLEAAGTYGEARSTRDGFIVLAGSRIRKQETPTIPDSGRKKRCELLADGLLTEDESDPSAWTLTENTRFKSPSQAAYALTGSSISGPQYWKDAEGTPLGQLELSEAQAVENTSPPIHPEDPEGGAR